jgi:hypothetical protein
MLLYNPPPPDSFPTGIQVNFFFFRFGQEWMPPTKSFMVCLYTASIKIASEYQFLSLFKLMVEQYLETGPNPY